jgi:hypothetical protein
MPEPVLDRKTARRLAGYELTALLVAGALPLYVFQKGRIQTRSTSIYDINGQVLFYRFPLSRGRTQLGFADVAASPAFPQPLLSVSHGQVWDADDLLEKAEAAAHKHKVKFTSSRFVAYSYPKLAVQFLSERKEVLLLELFTWAIVPPLRDRRKDEPPGNFERWSLLDELPANRREENSAALRSRLQNWDNVLPRERDQKLVEFNVLDTVRFENVIKANLLLHFSSGELHYSPLSSDHHPCYELRGQLTNVWCVAASTQMVLDFYRYNYSQVRIAAEEGLGTLTSPNGLPYGNEYKVVNTLQKLTSNALTAHLDTSPNWAEFVSEINANRPLISFIPGHSRSVAGYSETSLFGWFIYQGLLVYDPWPPTTGVITRYENFATQTYRDTFTAHLTLA